MADHPVRRGLTPRGLLTARPAAFVVLSLYAAAWIVFDRHSLNMHGVAPWPPG